MMKKPDTEPLPDPRLEEKLSILREMPARNPNAARLGRERFLAEVKNLQAPARPWGRLAGLFRAKPKFAFSPLLAILLAVAVLLLGAGTTVYASQGSQPDDAFYAVKLWTEDVRLRLAQDDQARLQLDQEFTGRRVAELIALEQSGKSSSPAVGDRLQSLVDDALRSASALPEIDASQALANLADNLARHQEQLEKLSQKANPRAAAEFARVVAMLDLRQEQAAQGEHDPAALHEWMRQMKSENQEIKGNPESQQTPASAGTEKTAGPDNSASGKGSAEPGISATHTPRANGQGTPGVPGKGKGDK